MELPCHPRLSNSSFLPHPLLFLLWLNPELKNQDRKIYSLM